MTKEGTRPDRPDLAVLLSDTSIGQVWSIVPEQASIVVGPGRRGGKHRAHPPPILVVQRRGTHHGGVP